MTPAEAVDLLRRLTYKPDWKLTAEVVASAASEAVAFRVGTTEWDAVEWFDGPQPPDTNRLSGGLDVTQTFTVRAAQIASWTERDLLAWAFECVRLRELHGVEEWLRLDRRSLYSPHPGRMVGILGDGTSTPT